MLKKVRAIRNVDLNLQFSIKNISPLRDHLSSCYVTIAASSHEVIIILVDIIINGIIVTASDPANSRDGKAKSRFNDFLIKLKARLSHGAAISLIPERQLRKIALTILPLTQESNQENTGTFHPSRLAIMRANPDTDIHEGIEKARERERERERQTGCGPGNAAARSPGLLRFFPSVSGENSILEGCIGNAPAKREGERRRILHSTLFTCATTIGDGRGTSRAGGYRQNIQTIPGH